MSSGWRQKAYNPPTRMATTVESTAPVETIRCANCDRALSGPFCSACGQEARDVHRPFGALAREAVGHVFNWSASPFQ